MFSTIKRFFKWIGGFIKNRPVTSLVIFLAVLVAGTFVTYQAMHLTSKPAFCRLCHPMEEVGVLGEYNSWRKNIHSFNEVECLDCHSKQPGVFGYVRAKVEDGLYDLIMQFVISRERKVENLSKFIDNPEESSRLVKSGICLHCHSDKINEENRKKHFMTFFGISMRKLDTVKNPEFREMHGMVDLLKEEISAGVEPNHAVHLHLEVPCSKCHQSVVHCGEYRPQTLMQICFDCHDEMRLGGHNPVDSDDCAQCHVTQAEIVEGVKAQKYGVEDNRWVKADLGCDSCCHLEMPEKPNKETCLNCHEDAYADLMVSFQDQFDMMFKDAVVFYKKSLSERKSMMTPENRAVFIEYEKLYKILDRDKSRSMHNPDYVYAILDRMSELESIYVNGSFQEKFEMMHKNATAFYKKANAKRLKMTPEKRVIFSEYEMLLNIVNLDRSRVMNNPAYGFTIFDRLGELEKAYNK